MTERLRNAPKLTNAEKQKPVFPKIIFEISIKKKKNTNTTHNTHKHTQNLLE